MCNESIFKEVAQVEWLYSELQYNAHDERNQGNFIVDAEYEDGCVPTKYSKWMTPVLVQERDGQFCERDIRSLLERIQGN